MVKKDDAESRVPVYRCSPSLFIAVFGASHLTVNNVSYLCFFTVTICARTHLFHGDTQICANSIKVTSRQVCANVTHFAFRICFLMHAFFMHVTCKEPLIA